MSGASACVGGGDCEWAWEGDGVGAVGAISVGGGDGVGAVGVIDVGGGECVGGCGFC